ncbi:MAG TPA: hypothetical protein VGQ21_01190 [Thermoanaerobaculia bacterium]|jgi:hypothetical protein|nr:hypothetical protein [Thermoanaerobaculia bacterium]
MTKVEALKRDVQSLTAEELKAFRSWFAEYVRQLEADAADGKLHALAADALAE